MPENIKLYDPDWTEVLLETEDRGVATKYLINSGKSRLPMTISYGTNWRQRWSGMLEISQDGTVETYNHSEFMKYLTTWPEVTA